MMTGTDIRQSVRRKEQTRCLLWLSRIGKVELSESPEELKGNAFCGCWNLKELRLPDSLVTIEKYAINCCCHLILGASLRKVKYEGCNCEVLILQAQHAPGQIKLVKNISAME